ncbi:MAG: hypothetical protein IPI65_13755 [Bacteroidetes bacterium]|nr:hypothetical protein [Bacteroidota bacterium]
MLENDTTFLQYLQGLYIAADTLTDGYSRGMMYFDMSSVISGFVFITAIGSGFIKRIISICRCKTNYFTNKFPVETPAYQALANHDTTSRNYY